MKRMGIKSYSLSGAALDRYNLTPKKYKNALMTKQNNKTQVLSEKQESF